MALFRPYAVALAAVVTAAVAKRGPVLVFTAKTTDFFVFFKGDDELAHQGLLDGAEERGGMMFDHEELLEKIDEGDSIARSAADNHSFVVRSNDMQFRAKLVAGINYDSGNNENYPYRLRIKNIMMEGGTIEVKHSGSGYTRLDPGRWLEHITDVLHEFELRDRDNTPRISVKLLHPDKNDL